MQRFSAHLSVVPWRAQLHTRLEHSLGWMVGRLEEKVCGRDYVMTHVSTMLFQLHSFAL